jgi:hypothetical protein
MQSSRFKKAAPDKSSSCSSGRLRLSIGLKLLVTVVSSITTSATLAQVTGDGIGASLEREAVVTKDEVQSQSGSL